MKKTVIRTLGVVFVLALGFGILIFARVSRTRPVDDDLLEAEPVHAAVQDGAAAGQTDVPATVEGISGEKVPSDWNVPHADIEEGSKRFVTSADDGTVGSSILPAREISPDAVLPDSAMLEMETIMQEPELPTGCESVALTMALNSLGYTLSKTEFAEKYLIYSNNIVLGYVGDPFSEEGAGIYAPGLVRSANRFLEEKKSVYKAYDASGFTLDDLLHFIAAGHPVVVWGTMYFEEPWMSEDFFEYKEEIYDWYWNEHCLALQGYDLSRNLLFFQDPLQGEIAFDLDEFRDIYDEIGRYAMTIY